MKTTFTLLLFLFGTLVSSLSYSCDWDMRNWRRDSPGRWHGQDYYGCPHMTPDLERKFQKMPGAELFQTKGCTGCHTIGEGDKVGPDLSGLFKRRDEKWIREFIRDPTGNIQTDSTAGALKEQYGSQMPYVDLSSKELNQIVRFLKVATQGT